MSTSTDSKSTAPSSKKRNIIIAAAVAAVLILAAIAAFASRGGDDKKGDQPAAAPTSSESSADAPGQSQSPTPSEAPKTIDPNAKPTMNTATPAPIAPTKGSVKAEDDAKAPNTKQKSKDGTVEVNFRGLQRDKGDPRLAQELAQYARGDFMYFIGDWDVKNTGKANIQLDRGKTFSLMTAQNVVVPAVSGTITGVIPDKMVIKPGQTVSGKVVFGFPKNLTARTFQATIPNNPVMKWRY